MDASLPNVLSKNKLISSYDYKNYYIFKFYFISLFAHLKLRSLKLRNPNVLISSDYGPIIINANDSVIGKHISMHGYWASDDIDIIKQLVNFILTKKEFVVFYDVGANIGTHSLAIGKTFKEKVKIRAFEAQRQIYNMLCGTVALNGLDNIYCHNLAVSDGSLSEISIPLLDYNEFNNFGALELIPPRRSDNQSISIKNYETVEVTTLDNFNEVVDFIKIDIEGMEDKAFMGAKLLLENHRPICFIETHKTDTLYLIDLFKSMKFVGFQKHIDLIVIPVEHQIQVSGWERIF